MKDKDTIVRNYILQQLEDGTIKEGDKLLAARVISSQINVSFAKVQQGIEKLVQDGVLETVPRQGTFVQKDWHNRILQTNFCTYNSKKLLWLENMPTIFSQKLPQLRASSKFKRGVFELMTTLTIQSDKDD
jgi:DNA-binding transcriptional regulator YhcF (GntR family)